MSANYVTPITYLTRNHPELLRFWGCLPYRVFILCRSMLGILHWKESSTNNMTPHDLHLWIFLHDFGHFGVTKGGVLTNPPERAPLLWMEEILHHLGWLKPYTIWLFNIAMENHHR